MASPRVINTGASSTPPECTTASQLQYVGCVSETGLYVEVGNTYKVKGSTTSIAVTAIKHDVEPEALGFLIVNGLEKDVEVRAPLKKLLPIKIDMSRPDASFLLSLKHEHFSDTINNLKTANVEYRRTFRKSQLCRHLRKEVKGALKSKGYQKDVNLGLACLEIDTDLFKISLGQKRVFNYLNNSIGELDSLLGMEWDIDRERRVAVTEVRVKLTKDLQLKCSVKAAAVRMDLPVQGYRVLVRECIGQIVEDDLEENVEDQDED